MNGEMLQVFAILGVTIGLFVSEKLAIDLVGLLALLTLYLTGLLTVEEALAGFSNSVVVTLAALFVVGGALFRTGVAARFGAWLASRGGGSLRSLTATVMVSSAILSAFMSSTGTAAILIPAVVGVARKGGYSPSKLLMPLAYGCLIGGMLTLVGTPPNLVVQEALIEGGQKPFHFFSFAPMGCLVLVLGVLYMNLGQRWLSGQAATSPEQEEVSPRELAEEYEVAQHLACVKLAEGSLLIGQTLAQADPRGRFGVNILALQQCGCEDPLEDVGAHQKLEQGQVLHCHGEPEGLSRFSSEFGLKTLNEPVSYKPEVIGDRSLAEVVLTPRSRLLGKTLKSSRFQERYRVNVVSHKRMGRLLEDSADLPFRFGDTLLVTGRLDDLAALRTERANLVVTGLPDIDEQVGFRYERAWVAVVLAVLMLVLMTFKLLPSVMAVLLVAAAALATGCLTTEDAYRSISWQSLILIACMLPLASALEKTGGVDYVATAMTGYLGQLGPQFVMAGLFILTSLFSQFISNTATTVIVTPIAIQAAAQSGASPQAFLMAVAVAASAAFATPVASPVNLLVLSPGGYRFGDFVKVGLPLQLAVMVLSVLVLPYLFPLF